MKRRQTLAAAGIGIAGLITTKRAVSGELFSVGGPVRLGLAPIVPPSVRSDDRATVATQLGEERSVFTSLRVNRAASEWALLRGLSNANFDIVELGAVAGTVALETGLAKPLLQPTLAGKWEYEGKLLADDGKSQPAPRVAVGEPLATPSHAALAQYGEKGIPVQPSIQWHVSQPTAALDSDAVTFAASDEFYTLSEPSVYCSYSLPVPGLYIRVGTRNIGAIQEHFTTATGGDQWYGDVRQMIDRGDAEAWFDDLSLPVDPA